MICIPYAFHRVSLDIAQNEIVAYLQQSDRFERLRKGNILLFPHGPWGGGARNEYIECQPGLRLTFVLPLNDAQLRLSQSRQKLLQNLIEHNTDGRKVNQRLPASKVAFCVDFFVDIHDILYQEVHHTDEIPESGVKAMSTHYSR